MLFAGDEWQFESWELTDSVRHIPIVGRFSETGKLFACFGSFTQNWRWKLSGW